MKAKLLAKKENEESGNKANQKKAILDYAKKHKFFFIRELEEELNIARTTVVARVSELEDEGIVIKGAALATKYASAKQSHYSYIDDIDTRKEHAELRNEERFQRWVKNGEKYGHFDRFYSNGL